MTPIKPKTKCQHCGAEVSRGFLPSHQKRPGCVAEKNRRMMERRGMRIITDDMLIRVAQGAGLTMEHQPTKHGEIGSGRTKKKSALLFEHWAPSWYYEVFGSAGSWELRRMGKDTVNVDEGVKLYIPIVQEAATSPEQQEALIAMHAMSGIEGVKSLVFTSRLRATKLRKEAEDFREKAKALEAEAEGLDPSRIEVEIEDDEVPCTKCGEGVCICHAYLAMARAGQ